MKFVLDGEALSKVLSPFEIKFYNAEFVQVGFMTSRKVLKKLIPKPLKPSSMNAASAFVARYPRTSFGSVYTEAALSLNVEFDGEPGSYCLSMPVTDDMALILGREVLGFPKKMAEKISLTTTDSGAMGSCVRRGVEILKVSMPFEREVEEKELIKLLSSFTPDQPVPKQMEGVNFFFKYFMAPDGSGFDYKPRVVKQVSTLRALSKIKLSNTFDLTLKSSDRDFLGEVPVKSPIMGAYGVYDLTMHPGKVVAEIDEAEFAPYAFSKIDFLTEQEELKPEAKI